MSTTNTSTGFTLQLLRFRNTDDKPVTLKHAQTGKVVIPPGEERILPIEYATLNVGHPNAVNEGKNLWRDQMYAHIRTRWGFYPGLMTEDEWDVMKPKIELYTLDTNERVFSVIEDPEGTRRNPDSIAGAEATDGNFLQAQVAAMQQQIERLTALIASQQLGGAPLPAEKAMDKGYDAIVAAMEHVTKQNERQGAVDAVIEQPVDEHTIPPPPKGEKVGKDSPRTTRVGSRS